MPRKDQKNSSKTNGHHVDANGNYRLQGELFWKYRAVDSDFVRLQHEQKAVKVEIETIVNAHPELKELFARQRELANQSSLAMTELQTTLNEIERHLGVEIKNCAIDDKTGVIHILKQDGTSIPLSAKKPAEKKGKKQPGSGG